MNILEVILTLVSAFGGVELFKWWYTRKPSRRLANATAAGEEFRVLSGSLIVLQEQVQKLVSQMDELYDQISHLRESHDQEHGRRLRIEAEYMQKRCDRLNCPNRIPPYDVKYETPA